VRSRGRIRRGRTSHSEGRTSALRGVHLALPGRTSHGAGGRRTVWAGCEVRGARSGSGVRGGRPGCEVGVRGGDRGCEAGTERVGAHFAPLGWTSHGVGGVRGPGLGCEVRVRGARSGSGVRGPGLGCEVRVWGARWVSGVRGRVRVRVRSPNRVRTSPRAAPRTPRAHFARCGWTSHGVGGVRGGRRGCEVALSAGAVREGRAHSARGRTLPPRRTSHPLDALRTAPAGCEVSGRGARSAAGVRGRWPAGRVRVRGRGVRSAGGV
jgi:hypothetical protein